MQLTDDELFKLWRDKKMYVEDVLSKAKDPDELARRIVEAKRKLAAMEIDPAKYPVATATFHLDRRLGWRDGEVYVFDGQRVTIEKLLAVGAQFYTHAEVEAAMLEWEEPA